jgi:hypothetical protein
VQPVIETVTKVTGWQVAQFLWEIYRLVDNKHQLIALASKTLSLHLRMW